MTKASERTAADLQATRDRDHAATLRANAVDVIETRTVATVLRAQAESLVEDKRRGWQGASRSLLSAAEHVEALAVLLERNPAPTNVAPPREPIDLSDPTQRKPAPGIPSERGAADIAAGSNGASRRNSTVTAHCKAEYVPPAGAAPGARIVRCGKTADHTATPGYASHQEYLGNGEWGPDWTLPAGAWPDGPITPDAATRVRLAIESGKDTDAKLDAAFGPPEVRDVVHIRTLPAIERPTLASLEPVGVPETDRPRMTLVEVAAHGRARARGADHRSHSQLSGYENCGVQYALSDLESAPAWWNVGGTAVHAAIESINRGTHIGGSVETLWSDVFERTVAETEITSGIGHPMWRAASRGAEAYDWWRVEGESMVSRWVEFLRRRYAEGWTILEIDGVPVIEYAYTLPIDGCPVPDTGVIDVALKLWSGDDRDTARIEIIDIKAGKSAPREGFQIGGLYHWAIWRALSLDVGQPILDGQIEQAFWMARQADPVNQLVPAATVPWPDVCQRMATMDAAERQGLYVPRPSNFCSACAVKDLCPAGPQRLDKPTPIN